MKTKLIAVALLVGATLVVSAQAGSGNRGGGGSGSGGGHFAAAGGGRGGSGPSFRGMPGGGFGGNRMIYSGERFSSVGMHAPRSMEFRPHYVNSNANAFRARQFAPGNISRAGNAGRFSNVASNGGNRIRNGNNLPANWRNHVFAQHSVTWHRDWNRNADHWWHGHRCHFFNGSWVIFDVGFYPWWGWPYWDPYYYGYEYGYGYPYQYDYNQGYYDSGVYDSSAYYDHNSYADQSGNSTIASVQERLAREGYYRGQIDGVFGQETRAALAEYQSNRGLRVTGTLTPDTLRALGLPRVASY